jgi:uncharacterized membrane protein (UPF0127 family)
VFATKANKMASITVHNLDRPLRLPLKIRYCDEFLTRLRGLMFRPPLGLDEGIVLVQKRENRTDASIHMFFMRMDLTVVWLNSAYEVVDLVLARRWRPVYVPQKPARYVLEISTERFPEFRIGDRLEFGRPTGQS